MLFDPKKTRELGLGIGLSFQLVVTVVLGLYLGTLVDERYEMQPFGSLIGAIMGFITGMITLVTIYNRMED